MQLQKALEALKPLKNFDKLVIQEKLNSGFTLVCAEQHGFQTAIKYVWKVKGNLLYSYKLSDSSPDHIVLTLEQVNKMVPGLYELMYDEQDLILEDVEGKFDDVDENLGSFTEKDIQKIIGETDIAYFKS